MYSLSILESVIFFWEYGIQLNIIPSIMHINIPLFIIFTTCYIMFKSLGFLVTRPCNLPYFNNSTIQFMWYLVEISWSWHCICSLLENFFNGLCYDQLGTVHRGCCHIVPPILIPTLLMMHSNMSELTFIDIVKLRLFPLHPEKQVEQFSLPINVQIILKTRPQKGALHKSFHHHQIKWLQ